MPVSYPYGFSCWYGYDKDCVTLTSYTSSIPSSATIFTVCSQSTTATYYHDGSGTYPVTGDVVYSSSAGGSSNYLSSGYYKINNGGNGLYIQVGNNGIVSNDDVCF